MSVLYESYCVLTRKRLTEMTRLARSPKLVAGLAVLLAIAWAVVLLGGLYPKADAALWGVTAALVAWFFLPTINGSLQYYRFNKLYKEPVQVVVRLYEDRFENYTPIDKGMLKLTYDRIRRIYEGRHGIYLRLDKGFFVTLDPERFTLGTAEEALAFLREKMNAGPG